MSTIDTIYRDLYAADDALVAARAAVPAGHPPHGVGCCEVCASVRVAEEAVRVAEKAIVHHARSLRGQATDDRDAAVGDLAGPVTAVELFRARRLDYANRPTLDVYTLMTTGKRRVINAEPGVTYTFSITDAGLTSVEVIVPPEEPA